MDIVTRLYVKRTRIPVSFLDMRKTCSVLQSVHTNPDSYSVGAGNKQPGREAIHLHLSSAKAKNEWRCNFITPYAFMTCRDAILLATVKSYVRLPTHTVCVWLLAKVLFVLWVGVGTCAICRQLEPFAVQRSLLYDVTESTSIALRRINALRV